MFLIRNSLLSVMAFGLFLQCTVLDVGGDAFLTGRPGEGGSWELIFYDEFDGTSIDRNKWTTGYWWDRDGSNNGSSNELEWYQPDDVLVNGGTLQLRAQERRITAWDGTVYDYTSAIITTGRETSDNSLPPKFLFQYGYAEIRCRVPKGRGLWPAFWLLPATHESRPEIDVMEILGHDPTEAHLNYHYVRADGRRGDGGFDWIGPDFSAGWHTFAVDWQPNIIIWYVDGIERWRFTEAKHISSEPMYLIANLAVGGDWPGAPDASTPFPSYFEVDYIRVWARGKYTSLSPTNLPDMIYEIPMDVALLQHETGGIIPLALHTSESDGVYLHSRKNPAYGPQLPVTSLEH